MEPWVHLLRLKAFIRRVKPAYWAAELASECQLPQSRQAKKEHFRPLAPQAHFWQHFKTSLDRQRAQPPSLVAERGPVPHQSAPTGANGGSQGDFGLQS